MQKIEHIGIAVKDLAAAKEVYENLLGVPCYKEEKVESESVNTAFFRTGNNKIELLAATNEDSAIHKYLDKNREGVHHIAFAVQDIHEEMKRLRKAGFRLLNEEPKRGADNKLICFVHPKDNCGVLIELCQEINNK